MSEKITKTTKRVAKKPAGKGHTSTVGAFKLPNNILKGIQKAANKQGFTKFGVYAVG